MSRNNFEHIKPETLTIRQYYAAMAMQGILSNAEVERNLILLEHSNPELKEKYHKIIAELSFKMADAMIEVENNG